MTTSGSVSKIAKLFLEFKASDKKLTADALGNRRKLRKQLYKEILLLRRNTPADLKARREYWYKQISYLKEVLKKQALAEGRTFNFKTELKAYLKDKDAAKKLLQVIVKEHEEHSKKTPPSTEKKETVSSTPIEKKVTANPLKQADVLEVIKDQIKKGHVPVVNNAANANRDGTAKLSRGSLEEAIARQTDSMLSMVCHFRDVDAEHWGDEPNQEYVEEFQMRYLRSCLSTINDIMEQENPDQYIDSQAFLKKFLEAEDGIYFDLQNTVYEVDSEKGFTSHMSFSESKLSSFSDLEKELKEKKTAPKSDVVLVYAAAPDRRRLQGAPYDKHCTLDPLLGKPKAKATLKKMIEGGIKTQCEEAIRMKDQKPKPHVIFVLPGCGEFGNPLRKTARIFTDAIKSHQEDLENAGITFSIVEKNPKTFEIIREAWNAPAPEKTSKYGEFFRDALCLVVPSLYVRWLKYKAEQQIKEGPLLTDTEKPAPTNLDLKEKETDHTEEKENIPRKPSSR